MIKDDTCFSRVGANVFKLPRGNFMGGKCTYCIEVRHLVELASSLDSDTPLSEMLSCDTRGKLDSSCSTLHKEYWLIDHRSCES